MGSLKIWIRRLAERCKYSKNRQHIIWRLPDSHYLSVAVLGPLRISDLERCRRITSHSHFSCTCFFTHVAVPLSFHSIISIALKPHLEHWMENTSFLKTCLKSWLLQCNLNLLCLSLLFCQMDILGYVIFQFPHNHFVKTDLDQTYTTLSLA